MDSREVNEWIRQPKVDLEVPNTSQEVAGVQIPAMLRQEKN
jgi:vacuolar-type H+-ATPase subunit D/Vma8